MAGEHDVNAGCGPADFVCASSEGFLNSLFHGVTGALGDLAAGLGTFWIHTPAVPLEGDDNVVKFLQDSTLYYTGVLLIFSFIIAGIKMIWTRKGQPMVDLLASLMRYLIVSAAAVPAVALMLSAGDQFSGWIIDKSTDEGFSNSLAALLGVAVFTSGITPGIAIFVIVMGIIAILLSVMQIGMLIIRSALALLLVGTLPLAFSATNTDFGRQWSQKQISWLIAFILYKPVASLIYAAAFKIFGSFGKTDGDIGQKMVYFISGLILMIAALLALPAMMRLIVPAVGATSTAGGAMFAGAAISKGASGAVNFGSRGAAGGGAGGAAGAGASGAGGGGAATGAAASKGAAAAGAGAATGGAGLAVMAAASAASRGAKSINSAVHDAAGEQAPESSSSSSGSKPSGGSQSSGSSGSSTTRGGNTRPAPPPRQTKGR